VTKLSRHFELAEFLATATGIEQTPNAAVVDNPRALCDRVLEPVRRRFGRPVIITSGYRNEELNKRVGGVRNSQHLLGEAADFFVWGEDLIDVFSWLCQNTPFDQTYMSSRGGFIHVSYRAPPRHEILNPR